MPALIFQIAVFILYVGYVVKYYGILPSISESWYRMRYPAMFTLFCFALGFPMFFHSREFNQAIAGPGDYTFLFYLSMFLCFTGAATDFKKKVADKVHFIGAAISIIAAVAGITLQYQLYWLPIGWLISLLITILFAKNRVWWVEIFSFAWIMAGLFKIYFL